MRNRAKLLALVIPFLFSCASATKGAISNTVPDGPYIPTFKSIEPPDDRSTVQIGIASWYGIEEHDRFAANGERFSKYDLSAAHKTLPMGSVVRITNLENGRDVVVRINDRGPFVEGRIIDLSHAAAESIGMVQRGVVKVKVEVISSPLRKNNYFDGRYTVQVGSFKEMQNALGLKDKIGGEVRVEPIDVGGETHYRVRVGRFAARDDADRIASELRHRHGYPTRVVLE
ncbi:MAG: septal ring lytic transglycosylase RlpA family protein [Deltaproteobacteria bacterium]